MKVSDLLTDESKWTQGAYGRDTHGKLTSIVSHSAVCWCLVGALWLCYRDGGDGSDDAANDVERRVITRIGNMAAWNDAPNRTFAEVRALVLELDL